MEEGGGRRRRPSLLQQMAAVDRSRDLPGLTLEDLTGAQKPPANAVSQKPAQPPVNRTLLDVIRDEERNGGSLFGHKDKKTWKAFRDKLRLMRAGAAWTSTVPIPASDVPIQSYNYVNSNNFNGRSRSLMSRRTSMRFDTVSSVNSVDSTHGDGSDENSAVSGPRPQMTRRESSRYGLSENALPDSSRPDNSSVDTNVFGDEPPARSFRPQMTRRESSRYGLSENAPSDSSRPDNSSVDANAVGDEPPARSFQPQMSRRTSTRHAGIPAIENNEEQIPESSRQPPAAMPEERSLSAREAVAAQEAAEAAAAEQLSPEEPQSTAVGGGVEAEPVRMSLMDLLEETDRQMGVVGSRYTVADENDGCDEEEEEDDGGDGVENTCCVCMVRHKGAAFIPCGHTFCRLCSRELWVQRGNCPLCNGYILEILDIF